MIAPSNVPCTSALEGLWEVCRTDPNLPVSTHNAHQDCCTLREDSLTTKSKSSEHKWNYQSESVDYQTNHSHVWRRRQRHSCALSQSQSQSFGLHSVYTQQCPSNFFSQDLNLHHHCKQTNTNAKSGIGSWTMLLSLVEVVLCFLCLLSSVEICSAATDLDTSFNHNLVQSFRNSSYLAPTKEYLDPCKAGMCSAMCI